MNTEFTEEFIGPFYIAVLKFLIIELFATPINLIAR